MAARPPGARPRRRGVCSFTRSSPVVTSVTGCSAWRRAVDLEERDGPALVGSIEELDGAGVAIADRPGQVDGRRAQLALLLGAERRRARLLDQPPGCRAGRAVPDAGCPDGAVVVGDDLHLDVGAPGRRRPGRRGSDRHAHLLGEPLDADLVAQAPNDVGRRTDEDDADASAHLGEGGILGDEAPSRPRPRRRRSRAARARARRGRGRGAARRRSTPRRPRARTSPAARPRCATRSSACRSRARG